MEQGIITTLRYFLQFDYAPTFSELYMFHPTLVSEARLNQELQNLHRKKKILCTTEPDGEARYTLGGYSTLLNKTSMRASISRAKIKRLRTYLRILQKMNIISLIGLSGSVAMGHADHEADVDLFIITQAGRMWSARAAALAAAAALGVRRGRLSTPKSARNKVCLNMFMDESDLKVPKQKQTSFVAHEILQMKPVFTRGAIYHRFLQKNAWIFTFFPNAKTIIGPLNSTNNITSNTWSFIETILKTVQLSLINRHKTTEIITDTQLWFFPDDFEKKVRV